MSPLLLVALFTQLGVEDYDAMFQQNAVASQTLRVTWRRTSKPTEAPWQHQQKMAEKFKAALERGKVSATTRASMERMIQQARAAKAPDIASLTRTIQQDFWTNRERYQWRYRWSSSNGHEFLGPKFSELQHPNCESLPSDLATSLSDRLVISGGFDDGKFRVWFGGEKIEQHRKGAVTLKPPAIEVEYFPPLAMPRSNWQGNVHPIDAFFRPDPVQQRVVGEYTLDGVPTVVVVKVWKTTVKGINGWDIERAYLDVVRGAIPRRIEYGVTALVPALDTFTVETGGDEKQFKPSRIVRDVKIEEVRPNYYYPIRGFDDEMGTPPEDAGAAKVSRRVVYQTADWVATKIELDRAMSSEMFDLKFPPNTVFHDATTNEVRVTGGVDEFAELAINRAVQPVKSRSAWLWWAIPSGTVVVVIALVVFLRRRRTVR